ncbi:hypothetical protein C943_04608 [Mariniradius saccharolyticus AK6]|uniref:Uncharacterized protein n=1 Tax=Mariniradius saccharolyticus AK6 TaxID=1239962 RepID=M7XFT9_9BACT|nr:hypothetical protein C943_04608 [Mariniradius saccharolyticus AK6]
MQICPFIPKKKTLPAKKQEAPSIFSLSLKPDGPNPSIFQTFNLPTF